MKNGMQTNGQNIRGMRRCFSRLRVTGGGVSPDEEVRYLYSGPFILRQYMHGDSSGSLSCRRVLLFCLGGSAELCFQGCSYRLTPGNVAVVDGGRLLGCRYGAGTQCWSTVPA